MLLGGAVRDDGGPAHADADVVDQAGHPGAGQLLPDDRLLREAAALPAVVGCPGHPDEAGLGQHPLGAAQRLLLLAGVGGLLAGVEVHELVGVLGQCGSHPGAVGGLVGGVVEVHGGASRR